MKKIVLSLLVLALSAPVWASFTVYATVDSNSAWIKYKRSEEETKRFRAFALDISVDAGAKIKSVSNYKTDGESRSASKGYGIYMGNIDIAEDGTVTSYGGPVAPASAPDTPGQVGSAAITLEMGSLYQGEANAPDIDGTLCRIWVDKDCYLTVTADSTRGGVILEDASSNAAGLPTSVHIIIIASYVISGTTSLDGVTMNGLPGTPVTSGGGLYSATVTSGWSGTATPTKTGYTFSPTNRTYNNVTSNQSNQNYTATLLKYTISGTVTYNELGLDGVTMGGLTGTPVTSGGGLYTGTVDYGWSGTVTPTKSGFTFSPTNRTYSNVTSNQSSQGYTGSAPNCFPSTSGYTSQYADWVSMGKPTCWCGTVVTPTWRFQCDGDADNTTETGYKYRVYGNDMAKLTACWKLKATQIKGSNRTCACADIDHKSETGYKYRIYGNDVSRVSTNWKKKDTQLPKNCPRPDASS